MTMTTLLIIGIFLLACLVMIGLVALWAASEEKIFKLNCTVSELSAENGQLVRLADSLKNVASHQNLVIQSYARGWSRTGDHTPDLLTSRLHTRPLRKMHLKLLPAQIAMEETRPVPIAEAI